MFSINIVLFGDSDNSSLYIHVNTFSYYVAEILYCKTHSTAI